MILFLDLMMWQSQKPCDEKWSKQYYFYIYRCAHHHDLVDCAYDYMQYYR
jgi:hypothetical protein